MAAAVLGFLFTFYYYGPFVPVEVWETGFIALGIFEVCFIALIPRKTVLWLLVFGTTVTLMSALHSMSIFQPGPC